MISQPFEIYPAIDLRQGRVVRLQLGDPQRQTVFSDQPVEVARRWQRAGATWIHVVNLDGAFDEEGHANWSILNELTGLGLRVQFGGGLRTVADVERAITAGVTRVVLGTAALESPPLVAETLARFGPESIAVGIDARDGLVRTRGWQATTGVTPLVLAEAMRDAGVNTIVYTDIDRDGILTGVNVRATAELAASSGLNVIASGGVSSIRDIIDLRGVAGTGVAGVIIGRALYEGRVDLAEAIAVGAKGLAIKG